MPLLKLVLFFVKLVAVVVVGVVMTPIIACIMLFAALVSNQEE